MTSRYAEVLEVEVDGWCHGIASYPGELSPELVHRVIKELEPSILMATQREVEVDLLGIASRLAEASRHAIHEKEALLSLMVALPEPESLSRRCQVTLGRILARIWKAHPHLAERIQQRYLDLPTQFDVPTQSEVVESASKPGFPSRRAA